MGLGWVRHKVGRQTARQIDSQESGSDIVHSLYHFVATDCGVIILPSCLVPNSCVCSVPSSFVFISLKEKRASYFAICLAICWGCGCCCLVVLPLSIGTILWFPVVQS